MTDNRYATIGIKQVVRLEWMEKAANLFLAGLNDRAIRAELHEYIADKMGDGSVGTRGTTARSQIVNMLMRIWAQPLSTNVAFRDAAAQFFCRAPDMAVVIHWCQISISYPFWFDLARQCGRLLNLQEYVSQAQIVQRMKENYGDRETVARYSRYTIRSLVNWGILQEGGKRGWYKSPVTRIATEGSIGSLMVETSLMATRQKRAALDILVSDPAFFGFYLDYSSVRKAIEASTRLQIVSFAGDGVFVQQRS